jgi:hypothetical protein
MSEDAPEPADVPQPADVPEPADAAVHQAAGGWLALTATQRGAAHELNGLPNQDAVAVLQIEGDGLVAAVADGHGHHRHFRSRRGSELAVAIAGQAGEELAARLDNFEAAGQIESDVLATLVPAVTSRWRAAVSEDLAEEPFTIAEEEARAFGDDPLIAYGTTLLLAITWRNWLVLAQIGDGDIVCVLPDGRALLAVPGDPSLDGRQTTSLCGPRADQEFRAAAVNTAITPLLGVLIATDGFGNAQLAEPWPDAVAGELAELIGDGGPEALAEQVPLWASHCASGDGSGDDTTVALLIAPSAAALRQAETSRQQQATLPPAGDEGEVPGPEAGDDAEAPGRAAGGWRRRFAAHRGVRPGRRGGGGAGGDALSGGQE